MKPRRQLASAFFATALVAGASFAIGSSATTVPPARTVRAASAATSDLRVPVADRRSEDQTYLTFPEWFLVFSPDEDADMLEAGQPASAFPFFSHIGQFWGAYRQVIGATRGRYPFNAEYHTMIVVIGVSTTVEYAIKGAYETLVGRLSELASTPNGTAEDRLATREARDYVDFIRVRPWYEFDFLTPLRDLWLRTPSWGPHPVRKWERRYLLTSEWLIKAGYAALLTHATHSTFDRPKVTTLAVLEDPSADSPAALGLTTLQRDRTGTLVSLPRYQPFTQVAVALAARGVRFDEIAGNRGPILASIVVPTVQPVAPGVRVLIRQPILTRPGLERRALEIPVPELSTELARHAAAGDEIEHVFDY